MFFANQDHVARLTAAIEDGAAGASWQRHPLSPEDFGPSDVAADRSFSGTRGIAGARDKPRLPDAGLPPGPEQARASRGSATSATMS